MQVVSARFSDAITKSHKVAVKFQVFPGRANATSPIYAYDSMNPGTDGARLVEGSVTMDKQAAFRSRFDMKLVDPTGALVPQRNASDVLNPFGNEIVIWRGIDYQDGTSEVVKLGTFRLSKVQPVESQGGITLAISGWGRERSVSRNTIINFWPTFAMQQAQFVDPAAAPLWLPMPYSTFIRILIADRDPQATFDSDETSWSNRQNDGLNVHVDSATHVPAVLTDGEDPWQHAFDVAKTTGCTLYCDREGVYNFQRDPAFAFTSPTPPTPVFSFVEGETAIFDELTRTLSDEQGFNRYVVIGSGTQFGAPLRSDIADPANPVSVPADDTDPDSPTYINGPYGIVSKTENNSYIVTQPQVMDYAQLLLRSTIGGQEQVEFPSIVHPALDIDDVVSVTRTKMNIVSQLYCIDSLTIPLGATGKMQAKLRERRVIS